MNLSSRRTLRFGLLVIAAIVYAVFQWQEGRAPVAGAPHSVSSASGSVEQAWAERASGIWMEVEGRVSRVLSDDLRGSRHQRFIVELASGHTLLVAHNIDLAEKVPLDRGDRVEMYGEYEWNDRGGVLHWTHHDPGGRRAGGWVELDGRRYR